MQESNPLRCLRPEIKAWAALLALPLQLPGVRVHLSLLPRALLGRGCICSLVLLPPLRRRRARGLLPHPAARLGSELTAHERINNISRS